jgi:ribosomal protein S18 acetylase RimI-like enzyme
MLPPNLALRSVRKLEEALELAPDLDRRAAEFMAQFSDEPFPTGATEHFLRRHFDAPETVLLVARDRKNSERLGLCLTGPLEDPLLGQRVPMVLVLHIESAARHRGVARQMVDMVSELLASRGLTRLAARVGHNDDALISMGERWGFVRIWDLMLRE